MNKETNSATTPTDVEGLAAFEAFRHGLDTFEQVAVKMIRELLASHDGTQASAIVRAAALVPLADFNAAISRELVVANDVLSPQKERS